MAELYSIKQRQVKAGWRKLYTYFLPLSAVLTALVYHGSKQFHPKSHAIRQLQKLVENRQAAMTAMGEQYGRWSEVLPYNQLLNSLNFMESPHILKQRQIAFLSALKGESIPYHLETSLNTVIDSMESFLKTPKTLKTLMEIPAISRLMGQHPKALGREAMNDPAALLNDLFRTLDSHPQANLISRMAQGLEKSVESRARLWALGIGFGLFGSLITIQEYLGARSKKL